MHIHSRMCHQVNGSKRELDAFKLPKVNELPRYYNENYMRIKEETIHFTYIHRHKSHMKRIIATKVNVK